MNKKNILFTLIIFTITLLVAQGSSEADLGKHYLELANGYTDLKQYQKAEHFYLLAQKKPELARIAQYNLVRVWVLQKQWDKAHALLDTLLEQAPQNNELLRAQAYITFAQGKTDEALRLYQALSKKTEYTLDGINYARLLIKNAKKEEAQKVLQELLKKKVSEEDTKTIETMLTSLSQKDQALTEKSTEQKE